MFQVGAREFLLTKSESEKPGNVGVAVGFEGDMKWYTNNEGCNHSGFSCYFLDPIEDVHPTEDDDEENDCSKRVGGTDFLPIQWNVFCWRVVQSYMFAPNPSVLAVAEKVRGELNFSGFPDVAFHIRRVYLNVSN